jgi:Ca2+/Na+ antiporter
VSDKLDSNKNRRLRPDEAIRRAPILFGVMFVAVAGFALLFDSEIDWWGCVEAAAFYAIAMTLALMTLRLTPKYP